MLKCIFSVVLVLGLAQPAFAMGGGGGGANKSDEDKLVDLYAQLKALSIDYTKQNTVTADVLQKAKVIQKSIDDNIKTQMAKGGPLWGTTENLQPYYKKVAELREQLAANQADMTTADTALAKLNEKADTMSKTPPGSAQDPYTLIENARFMNMAARANNGSAQANAKAAQTDAYLSSLEKKMDKQEIGDYVREKLGKFMNSTAAGCGMVNRCVVKAPTPIDPSALNDVFPESDPEKVSKEIYRKMRNTTK